MRIPALENVINFLRTSQLQFGIFPIKLERFVKHQGYSIRRVTEGTGLQENRAKRNQF